MPGSVRGASAAGLADADDTALVARAQEGYTAAFEELVRRHQARAFTLAYRLLSDRGDAQDAVQEAFVKAWTKLPGFDGRAAFSTWLHRVVVNQCMSTLRRRRPVPVPDDVERPAPVRTEQVVEERARGQALRRGVAGLPDDLRVALVLTTVLEQGYDEAGLLLGVPASTVRGRVARARRTLTAEMEGWS